jgi:biopolymer transport protein ExbB
MISKSIFVVRADAANQDFLEQFRDSTDPLVLSGGETNKTALARSCIYQLYDTGVRELKHRFATGKSEAALSAQSIAAIRASIDATMVKENHRLNSQMVLLTIAISGGPFLGLLGTVVGVMITFAAIAAAGDVNVNSIAPGIAAALVATVAGLGVAIPALFGYNYLASRIKNVTTDMQVFADEFETKLAERYAP